MALDPILAAFVPTAPLPADIGFPTWRAQDNVSADAVVTQVAEAGPEVADKRVVHIPVDGGTIALVIYRPNLVETLPAHLYFHGGGWITGTALGVYADIIGRERAVGADCVAITVDYRKAPEHGYPTPLNDCQAALSWVVDHADELGVDSSLITVGGASSGANLAAALCLKNRDESGPTIAFQLLEMPALDLALSLPSHADPALGANFALHRSDVERMVTYYLGADGDLRDPYASPLHAESHGGLPPAYLMPAECDMLRDDAAAYAVQLNGSGVLARSSLQIGHIHPSACFTKIMPAARAWRDEAIAVLRAVNAGRVEDVFSDAQFTRP